MEDIRTAAYDSFEKNLREELIRLCSQNGMMAGTLLRSDDIDAKWDEFARECMIDAVHNFNEYPDVALAWAAYLGMAVACHWDENWRAHHSDTYVSYYGPRGYDDMDEHIVRDILGLPLDSAEALRLSHTLSSCAALTQTLIRREGFESQSVEAYYVLIRCVKVMFQIGESLELHALGYKFTALN